MRLIESIMGLRPIQENLRQVFRLIKSHPRMRLEISENEPGISLRRPQHYY